MFPTPKNLLKAPLCAGLMLLAIMVNTLLSHNLEAFEMTSQAFRTEPWRFVTSALPHVGVIHLVFNLYWIAIFGVHFELTRGPLRFLAFVVTTQVMAVCLEFAFLHAGVGLSGVGYALFGYAWAMKRQGDASWAERLPDSATQTFVVWFFICIALTVTNVLPVANLEHLGGAAMGAVWGMATAAKEQRARWVALGVVLFAAPIALASPPIREHVNFTDAIAYEDLQRGYELMAASPPRDAEAEVVLKRAVQRAPKFAIGWYDLGVAESRLEHVDEAAAAFGRAYQLEPTPERANAWLATRLERVEKRVGAHGERATDGDVTELEDLSRQVPSDSHVIVTLASTLIKRDPARAKHLLREVSTNADAGTSMVQAFELLQLLDDGDVDAGTEP